MELKAIWKKHVLNFKRPAGTSRGTLRTKETYFIRLQRAGQVGYGECGLFKGLSSDDRPNYEEKLEETTRMWERGELTEENLHTILVEWPSLRFGFEMALRDIETTAPFVFYDSPFLKGTEGIETNGLIWMGEEGFMQEQLKQKLSQGFRCIKLKIGALDWDTEYRMLQRLRGLHNTEKLELRVDANGAFTESVVYDRLKDLKEIGIHSIEQPVKQGNPSLMRQVVSEDIVPIALDEELIGIHKLEDKRRLLEQIKPHYIILKPTLVGGWKASQEWIDLAKELDIGWWVTSALESNIGLAAISQWVGTLGVDMPQGLGTGSLFENNITSPLEMRQTRLWYNNTENWENPFANA